MGSTSVNTPDPPSVLIVEDDFIIADFLQTAMRSAGYVVAGTAARSGPALEIAERARPTLALVDIRLAAGNDGVELARQLHAMPGMRVIFLSGSGDPETRARAGTVPAKGFLQKPFRFEQLIEAVRAALGD
jgi:DNA-binding response OmpR family regulator